MKTSQTLIHNGAHQTVSLEISTANGPQSIRIGFTDQRLTRFGGMAFWSAFLHKKRFRHKLQPLLPQAPTSPNAYEPTDVALGFLGGILCGADKFSRVAYLADDPAVAEVLGIEAVASQSTFSRFFAEFTQASNEGFARLHGWAAGRLPSRREGYTLDLDSWALLHEDGQQEGVAVGYTRKGLKPCHRPLIAALAEPKLIAGFWLRRGDAACANNAVPFVENVLAHLPAHIRIGLVRGDAGFCHKKLLQALEQRGMRYIVVARLERKLQSLCRHDDTAWTATEVPGLTIQEVETDQLRQRLIILRHRVAERPQAGGKELLAVPGYRFQALLTNLPRSADAVAVWRRYNGRADSENRIKEVGAQFGVRGLCCQSFWATEAACQLAVVAYNLCVLLQRELGLLEKVELATLRWRLFNRAAVWSRAQGRATLKLAVAQPWRDWWVQLAEKLNSALPPLNCNAVEWSPVCTWKS
jgi:hypothetical protein